MDNKSKLNVGINKDLKIDDCLTLLSKKDNLINITYWKSFFMNAGFILMLDFIYYLLKFKRIKS